MQFMTKFTNNAVEKWQTGNVNDDIRMKNNKMMSGSQI